MSILIPAGTFVAGVVLHAAAIKLYAKVEAEAKTVETDATATATTVSTTVENDAKKL